MKLHFLVIFILACLSLAFADDAKFDVYTMKEFDFQGHPAKIVFPEKADANGYWIWRARFWGHEPQLDLALLTKGFHVVYVDVADLYGAPQAVNLWNDFYTYMTTEYKLNSKAVLEGMSRGGLIVYNWASQNTDKIFCLYADAPVCDIKSWPGGLFSGPGSEADWQKCLKAYNLDEASVLTFKGIPLYTCVPVAEEGIPVIHVCGEADEAVPYAENTQILAENFKKAGGNIQLILKPGVGHHPHSLPDPTPLVDFIVNSIKDAEVKSVR